MRPTQTNGSIQKNIMNISPWPCYSEEEAEAVKKVLLSNKVNYWTGDECRAFEKEFAEKFDARHAVALSNGTVSLEVSLLALGIGPGDEVVVTPRSFMASSSCVITVGATPVFADVDLASQNLTAATIEKVITPKTKAVIVVHLAGYPADMDPIMALAKKHNIYVIEDCAQAHGAKYKGRSVGSIGHIGSWSFCQDKIMTTGGEGGMITTNDDKLWKFIWSYKDHGKNWDSVYHKKHPAGYRWLHDSFGTNYRMTEMQGAIGRIQLRKLDGWTFSRKRNADKINEAVLNLPIFTTHTVPQHLTHAWYKWYGVVNESALRPNWDRDRIVQTLNEMGVPCLHGTCSELYREKAFETIVNADYIEQPDAKRLGELSITLPVHPTLKREEINEFCTALKRISELSARSA